jgi:hypothetical protein
MSRRKTASGDERMMVLRKGQRYEEWLLTAYERGRPASGTSVGVSGAPQSAGPTPPATGGPTSTLAPNAASVNTGTAKRPTGETTDASGALNQSEGTIAPSSRPNTNVAPDNDESNNERGAIPASVLTAPMAAGGTIGCSFSTIVPEKEELYDGS